jgi:hypothetical protein
MTSLVIRSLSLSVAAITVSRHSATPAPPPVLDVLTLVGFMLAVMELACYVQQHHSTSLVFGLGLAAAGMAVYAGLAGAWPLAMIQVVWSVMAFRRWSRLIRRVEAKRRGSVEAPLFWPMSSRQAARQSDADMQSRMTRMFGPL